MKITNSNISFQKTLIAKTQVLENNQPKQAFIYKLDRPDEYYYFEKAVQKQPDWKNADLIYSIKEDVKKYDDDIFVLEDEEQNCLGYVSTIDYFDYDFKERNTFVIKLETMPKYAGRSTDKKIKHVGKALVAFLENLKCKKEKRGLHVTAPAPDALDFYFKQGFEGSWDEGLIMQKPNREEQVKINFVS